MSNKKVLLSVTASCALATMLFGANETEAATYKVKKGDTLWTIATKYNTTVTDLKKINNLSSDLIFPNQVLKTSTSSKTQTPSSANQSSNITATGHTYTVKSGDTLSKIAIQHNISLSNLMKWNNLSSHLIYPGDVLVVSEKGSSSSSKSNASSNSSTSNNTPANSTSTTYKVKRGDTLSVIARNHGISLSNLMKWNNLTTTLIYPGDILVVSQSGNSSSANNNKSSNSSNGQSSKVSEYTVQAGDSLWSISRKFGVGITNLKQWNNLTSEIIYVGQKLKINEAHSSKGTGSSSANNNSSSKNTSYNVDSLIKIAKSYLGVPYVWGGSSPKGFDCSGFIYYVYKQAGMNITRTNSEGYYARSYYVNNPQVGDLVFFAGTYKSGISHVGIYLGNNQFISAASNSVRIDSLNNSYWKKHFDSFKRFY